MARVRTIFPFFLVLLTASFLAGTASGQNEGAGFKEGTSYTFAYQIEPLNFTIRVPKVTNIPITITSIVPIAPSGFNMSYEYHYKEMNDEIPQDATMTISVALVPVTSMSVVQERVNTSTSIMELLFVHNFSISQFSGNLTGENHPVLGNYSITWKPSGIIDRAMFTTTVNISQDGQTHPVRARITIGEAPPPAIPGTTTPVFIAVLGVGVVLVILTHVRGKKCHLHHESTHPTT